MNAEIAWFIKRSIVHITNEACTSLIELARTINTIEMFENDPRALSPVAHLPPRATTIPRSLSGLLWGKKNRL